MKKLLVIATWGLLFTGGCSINKNRASAFDSEREYRHRLYNGDYELIRFRPDGRVYAKMRVNGEEVQANGTYQIRNPYSVDVTLSSGPYRKIHFMGVAEFIESGRGFRWKQAVNPTLPARQHRVLWNCLIAGI